MDNTLIHVKKKILQQLYQTAISGYFGEWYYKGVSFSMSFGGCQHLLPCMWWIKTKLEKSKPLN